MHCLEIRALVLQYSREFKSIDDGSIIVISAAPPGYPLLHMDSSRMGVEELPATTVR